MNYYYLLSLLTIWFSLPQLLLAQKSGTQAVEKTHQVHISRTESKIKIDGRIDEPAWQKADKAKDFWMSFPVDDRKASTDIQTEVMLTYDNQFMYIAAICYGPDDYIIPTLKRDSRDFWRGDVFVVLIDPVNNAANGFSFGTNPAGVQFESLISGRTGTRAEMSVRSSGNSAINTAWDNKWYVEVSSEKDHWIVEMAIPFKSLRFEADKKVWGINFARGEPRSNSWHAWSRVPVQFLTLDLGYTGALIWDEPPGKAKSNISVIPYLLGAYAQDFEEGEAADWKGRIGGDAKIAITPSLNLDLTLNPDFSQVDVDQQVTNLTTFNIRFPERRLFFLENSDIFSNFGIPPMRPFFSRRIGLDEDGNTIPILYGMRLSGNLSEDIRIGLMNMQTNSTEEFFSQNYTSFSLHKRIFKRSTIKGYLHNRQAMSNGEFMDEYNRTAGLEFQLFSQNAKWQGFGGYGLSMSDGIRGDNYFYNFGGGYDGRNFTAYGNISGIGDNYYADMGWIPSADLYDAERDTSIHLGYNHLYYRLGYTIYPENPKINTHTLNFRQIMDVDNQFEFLRNRLVGSYVISFANTGGVSFEYTHQDVDLRYPFRFTDSENEPLPVGRYNFDFGGITYRSDNRKYFSWSAGFEYGTFYNGDRLQTSLGLRYRVQPWGNFDLNFVYNRLEFPDPYGSTNLFLIGPRIEINFSRNIFWTTFLQYNTQRDNFNINSRLQWRFQPLSDLFIVYTDNYAVEFWGKKNRGLVVKLNYWLNL